ncbi:MAG: hypothetical protein HY881_06995 [Deltaproteobacteria bacterium]|nr:hypothetical protein [Deltaproteobacteria bacterium]
MRFERLKWKNGKAFQEADHWGYSISQKIKNRNYCSQYLKQCLVTEMVANKKSKGVMIFIITP